MQNAVFEYTDDTLLEKYLEAGELSEEEVTRGLIAATRAGDVLPVLASLTVGLSGQSGQVPKLER